ncbi:hypothetical protein EP7_005630 (plasmid) [Isosphaeraceae bacterium EP7]
MIKFKAIDAMPIDDARTAFRTLIEERTAHAGPHAAAKATAIAESMFTICKARGNAQTAYCVRVATDLALEIDALIPGPCGVVPERPHAADECPRLSL